ncbi:MAG: DUF4261 domain-containing protein, partial [Gemmataceae bacterium]|nr:DUF4261 domain-containing protein [Gemmataceae bacterium]
LIVLNKIVLALFKAPGVLCYFNPNGEVLRDGDSFRDHEKSCREQEIIPLELWANIRFLHVNEAIWFMDTVGNAQLDLQDVEAFYPKDKYKAEDIDHYLRNVTLYLMSLDRTLQSGEEIDGPGEGDLSWTMDILEQGAIEPPRHIVRLYPKGLGEDVKKALEAVGRV